MIISTQNKQNFIFVGFCILTVLIAIISFRTAQNKWIVFKEAENHFKQQEFTAAIPLYKESLNQGMKKSLVLVHLAESNVAIGNFSEAIKLYRIFLDEYPHDKQVRLALAHVLSWNGNIQESEQEYNKILEENNNHNNKS